MQSNSGDPEPTSAATSRRNVQLRSGESRTGLAGFSAERRRLGELRDPFGVFGGSARCRVLRDWAVPGRAVIESVWAGGHSYPRHEHPRLRVEIILRGGAIEAVKGGTFERRRGDVLVRSPGTAHAVAFPEGGARALEIGVEIPADAGRARDGAAVEPEVLDLLCAGGLGARVRAELHAGDQAAGLGLPALLAELTGAFLRLPHEGDSRPRWLRCVEERLHDDPTLPSLEELAAQAGVHFTHLARVFRRRHGHTIGEYARRLRISRAARRLARGNEPVSRIAIEAGFADQSHFGRTFRVLMGVTPGGYRRMFRDE